MSNLERRDLLALVTGGSGLGLMKANPFFWQTAPCSETRNHRHLGLRALKVVSDGALQSRLYLVLVRVIGRMLFAVNRNKPA